MDIIIDDREKKPYLFKECYKTYVEPKEVRLKQKRLKIGDYSLVGMEKRVAIERKTLNDIFGTCSSTKSRRLRFIEELGRLGKLRFKAVIVEASIEEVLEFSSDWTKMNPRAVLGSMFNWSMRYSVPFFFCGDRKHGEMATYQILRQAFLIQQKKRR